ncbi:uncharacterized protein MONBRDRAFT_7318 [Monosiga brevicollis MX1]|uniref:Protein kinase domain-containing protein n=1 Tax=Monosiga brevicollis TaxID=81824 RepID=A9UWL5_MONBE|nr:uncharacterized protein MONBRDRAFT_7318 [Monosiga brevicollis MX1]EDQ90067.1 predicted protein [Monosiga brevicollis MX1]|eukprot:XP_001744834.1 hypothetical protein [Monosiga brevicollis MX1]
MGVACAAVVQARPCRRGWRRVLYAVLLSCTWLSGAGPALVEGADLAFPGCPLKIVHPHNTEFSNRPGDVYSCTPPPLEDLVQIGSICQLNTSSEIVQQSPQDLPWGTLRCNAQLVFLTVPDTPLSPFYQSLGCEVTWDAHGFAALDCDGRRAQTLGQPYLREMPHGGMPFNLRRLTLRHHLIRSIFHHNVFALQQLQELDVSHNRISMISQSALAQAPELLYLNLSHNILETLRPEHMPNLHALRVLDLRGNTFRELQADLLAIVMSPDCEAVYLPEGCYRVEPQSCRSLIASSNTSLCNVVKPVLLPCSNESSTAPAMITATAYCDGVVDCANGADEVDCTQLWQVQGMDVLQQCSNGILQATWYKGLLNLYPTDPFYVSLCAGFLHALSIRIVAAPNASSPRADIVWTSILDERFAFVEASRTTIYLLIKQAVHNGPSESDWPIILASTTSATPGQPNSTAGTFTTASSPSHHAKRVQTIVVIVIALVGLGVILAVAGVVFWRRGQHHHLLQGLGGLASAQVLERAIIGIALSEHKPLLERLELWCADMQSNRIAASQVHVREQLSRGRFGAIYLGALTFQSAPVIIKEPLSSTPEAVSMAISELLLLGACRHENIAKVIGVFSQGDGSLAPTLVISYYAGGDLRSYLQRHRGWQELPDAHFVTAIVCQLASALAHLASLQVVHRDVAARNVLLVHANGLTTEPKVVLSDFGHARVMQRSGSGRALRGATGDENGELDEDSGQYYRQRGLLETATRWQPPEVLREDRFSPASDAWSLGVLMYEVWTFGQVPYAEVVREADVLRAILRGARLALPEGVRSRAPQLFKLWQSLQATEPERRPVGDQVVLHLKAEDGEPKEEESAV